MKRIIHITLMALVISVARPTELQAWSFSSLSTNQKILGVVAVLSAAAFGIYWFTTTAESSSSAQKGPRTESAHTPSNSPMANLKETYVSPMSQLAANSSNANRWQDVPTRALRESDKSPSGPIPTKNDFNLVHNNETAQFVLQKIQELVPSGRDETLYFSRYKEWGIRLSITKINDTTLKISFSTWKPNGRGVDNLCAIFNKTTEGWKLSCNGTVSTKSGGEVTTNMRFTANTNNLIALFNRLCSLVIERL